MNKKGVVVVSVVSPIAKYMVSALFDHAFGGDRRIPLECACISKSNPNKRCCGTE
jgi:hypothetical protein